MSDNKASFVTGIEVGGSSQDKILILGLVDSISSDKEIVDRFILPSTVVAKLSNTLNKFCDAFEIDNVNLSDEDEDEASKDEE